MLKVFRYLKRQEWFFVFFSVIFIVIQVWLDLKLPDYMAKITKLIQLQGTSLSDLKGPAVSMLFCAIGSMTAAVIVVFAAAKVAAGLARRLRGLVYNQTLSFSMEEIKNTTQLPLV